MNKERCRWITFDPRGIAPAKGRRKGQWYTRRKAGSQSVTGARTCRSGRTLRDSLHGRVCAEWDCYC